MDHQAREGDNAVVDRRNNPGSAHLRRRHDGTPDHPCRGDLEDARLQPAKAPPDRAELPAWGNLGGRSSSGPAGAHPGIDTLYDIGVPIALIWYWFTFFRDARHMKSDPRLPPDRQQISRHDG